MYQGGVWRLPRGLPLSGERPAATQLLLSLRKKQLLLLGSWEGALGPVASFISDMPDAAWRSAGLHGDAQGRLLLL